MTSPATAASSAPAPRSPVFHCPYCGEEDLRPSEEHRSGWHCASCARVFSVTLHQIDRPEMRHGPEGPGPRTGAS